MKQISILASFFNLLWLLMYSQFIFSNYIKLFDSAFWFLIFITLPIFVFLMSSIVLVFYKHRVKVLNRFIRILFYLNFTLSMIFIFIVIWGIIEAPKWKIHITKHSSIDIYLSEVKAGPKALLSFLYHFRWLLLWLFFGSCLRSLHNNIQVRWSW